MLAVITGVLRHVLTFGGGFLVEDNLASGDEVSLAIGAVITLVGFGWSVFHKIKEKNA